MALGSFSGKVFSVSSSKIYTFDEFSRSSSLSVEEQELDGSKPSSYIKGSGLDEISFNILLIAQKTVDIETEINSWIDIKDAAKPNVLVIGDKLVGKNKFLLVGVSIQESSFDIKGKYKRAKLQLSFKEFVRYGKKEETETSDESKKSNKRTNTNASTAKANGDSSSSKKYPGYLIRYDPKKSDSNVKLIQQKLGMKADGYFGKDTETAVKNFQIKNKLSQDGIVGAGTWNKLFN